MGVMRCAWLVVVGIGCGDNRPPELSWGIGVRAFDAPSLGLGVSASFEPFASQIAETEHLVIPTYDGSDQAMHPDVVLEPGIADRPARLVMAMTPYPYSEDRFENPSVVVSLDGNSFREPVDGLNPLVEAPPIDHNDDPDIYFDRSAGEYRLFYLETLRPTAQNLIVLRSTDLVTWSRETSIAYDLSAGDTFIVSPSAIVHAGNTFLFAVSIGTGIEMMRSLDGRTWDRTTARAIAIDTGPVTPWHLDVFPCPSGFAMLISGYGEDFDHQHLYLATSPDLMTWSFRQEPLIAHDDPALRLVSLYRSTAIVANDRLIVWYSKKFNAH